MTHDCSEKEEQLTKGGLGNPSVGLSGEKGALTWESCEHLYSPLPFTPTYVEKKLEGHRPNCDQWLSLEG